jgi:ribonuclease T
LQNPAVRARHLKESAADYHPGAGKGAQLACAMVAAMLMSQRFRGFLPVVLDLETGGLDPVGNPILEIAAVQVVFSDDRLLPAEDWGCAVQPYPGSVLDPASLEITGIDPTDPQRQAIAEDEALRELFRQVRRAMKLAGCHRAILVAHNAAFDQQFLNSALLRTQIKRNPFHPFSFIDTASLAAVAYGHTVLSEACARARIDFDPERAHGALYDAQRTAELFCAMVNAWSPRWKPG